MDYEKRYKEALNVAREAHETYDIVGQRKVLEDIFPELNESEDEKVRKELCSYLLEQLGRQKDNSINAKFDRWFAWLEKQKEYTKKLGNSDADYDYEEIVDLAGNALGFLEVGACFMNSRCRNDVIEWLKSVPNTFKELMCTIERLKRQKKQNLPQREGVYLYDGKETFTFIGSPAMEEKVIHPVRQGWNEEDYRVLESLRTICLRLAENPHGETFSASRPYAQRMLNFLESLKPISQEWTKEDEEIVKFYEADCDNKIGDMPMKEVIENRLKFRDWVVNRLKYISPVHQNAPVVVDTNQLPKILPKPRYSD